MAPDHIISVGSELVAYGLCILYFYAGHRKYGFRVPLLFLVGSLYWNLILENVAVILGFFTYTFPNPSTGPYYILWTGLTPLWISIGWFDITFPAFMLLENVLPKASIWTKAVAGGVLALSLDLAIDPAATAAGLWKWTHPSLYFLGVPVTNYIGWFMLTAFYLAVYQSVHMKIKFSALVSTKPFSITPKPSFDVPLKTVPTLIARLMIFQLALLAIYIPVLYTIASIGTLPGG
ncbi:carotenoid biosynthesis protein [Candidatus Bathyarchaeota archaeon]|nr:carotenoid biosynthesis protein [Candidatus Bathyarchaeota archaeon]